MCSNETSNQAGALRVPPPYPRRCPLRPHCLKLRRDRLQHSLAHCCRLRPDGQLHFHCIGCSRPAGSSPTHHEETAHAFACTRAPSTQDTRAHTPHHEPTHTAPISFVLSASLVKQTLPLHYNFTDATALAQAPSHSTLCGVRRSVPQVSTDQGSLLAQENARQEESVLPRGARHCR